MKAAVTAASRGHEVSLYEQASQLGGQVKLASALPGRAEFGGVTTNLQHELKHAGVQLRLGQRVDEALVRELAPDHVVVASGATTRLPEVDIDNVDVIDAWSVISGDKTPGNRVVIADWSCDWNGLGVAELLARNGHRVRLMSGGSVAGESIQGIVRDQWIGLLHQLGVEMTPYAQFYGAMDGAAFFQHMTSGEAIICENVDTVVCCYAAKANREVEGWLTSLDVEVSWVGDAQAPRTVEEAVLEGLQAGLDIQ